MAPDAGQRPITASDLYRFRWASDVQLSPDGRLVAYVVTVPEEKGKRNRSEIWVVPARSAVAPCGAGRGGKRFTAGPRDRAPRWSPDGRWLAFLSDRGGETQIWLIRADGGEASQLTRHAGGAGEPVWSPDSKHIAFAAPVGEAPLTSTGEVDGADDRKSDVRVYTRLKYKANGKGLWDGKYSHVHVIPADGSEKARQVTSGPYDNAGPAWSPDAQWLAFSSNRAGDPDRAPTSDIWVVPAAGGEPRSLTRSEGQATQPAWSPDGRRIAFYGHLNEFRGATNTHISVVPVEGDVQPFDVLQGWDGSAGVSVGSDMMASASPPPYWSADGAWIYFQASERGSADLYRVRVAPQGESVQSHSPERLTEDRHALYALSLGPGAEFFVAARATFTNPGDVYLYRAVPGHPGYEPLCLTDINPWLRERALVEPEEMTFSGPDGDAVHGWVMKPVDARSGQLYPLVLEIHGGPQAAYGYAFVHEIQILCGAGIGVLFTNPPGSTGYGQAFAAATHHDWGGRDYRALMAAVDQVLELGWVDPARLGVTGGSFGGYMTNWIIAQTTRFAAAVTQRSTCNRYSFFGTSDIGFFQGDFQFRGNPWDEADFYLTRSPIAYVNRVSTPLLLIHSENDLRCPMEQAEQFYTALRWLGQTAQLVRFPDEHHELSRSGQPIHRVERLERILGWFVKYLLGR